MNVKAVIFDMDGLLFDTGGSTYDCYVEAAKKMGFEVNPNVFLYCTGMNDQGIVDTFAKLYGEDAPYVEYRKEIKKLKNMKRDLSHGVGKKKGAIELLTYLKEKNIPFALATSTNRKLVDEYLKLEGLENVFPYIETGETVKHSKPDPEIFLNAFNKLGTKKEETLVLEDSRVGVIAALNACLPVLQIEDSSMKHKPSVKGEYKLQIDVLDLMKQTEIKPTYKEDDLLGVIEFIERNNANGD